MPDRERTGTPGIFRRGDHFEYSIRVDGRQVWRSTDPTTRKPLATLAAAKKARNAELTDRERGTFTEPSKVAFGDWLDQWLAHQETRALAGDIKPSSLEGARLTVEAYLRPHLGTVRVQDITPTRLDKFYGELLRSGGRRNRGLSPKTVRNLASTVHNTLELARKRGLVPRNAAKDAHAPVAKRNPDALQHWDASQLGRFLTFAAGDRLAALWALLVVTGMRRGEALGLRWTDVTDAGVRVTRSRTSFAGTVREGTPKTDRSRRFVALDPATLAALVAWREDQAKEAVEVEMRGVPYNESWYVFVDEIGRPLHPTTVSRTFDRLVRASGVERIPLHGLRHTAATLLLANGVPVEVVSKRLGHATVGITLETYRHVMPNEEDRAAATMGQLVHGRHLRAVG